MKDKIKNLNNSSKIKKTIWKAVSIVLGSFIGFAGLVFLIIYLTGGFNVKAVNPSDIFFADVIISEDGTKEFVPRGTNPYNTHDDISLLISTSTKDINQTSLELNFPKTQNKYYIKEYSKEEDLSSNVKVFYVVNNLNEKIKYVQCPESQSTHITNGIIIAPKQVNINLEFKIQIVVAPNNLDGDVISSTDLYNVGGYSQLIASSPTNAMLTNTSVNINVDVPVSNIEILGITRNGSNESILEEVDGNVIVSTESLFSAILNVIPSRSIYLNGHDGKIGEKQYKKVIFSFDNDVNNKGKIINFIDKNNTVLEDSTINYSDEIIFENITYQGAGFTNYNREDKVTIYASIYKYSEDETSSKLSFINEILSEMKEKGLSTTKQFEMKQVEIKGFSVTEKYNEESPLIIEVNKENILYANNTSAEKELGIQIEASQGSAQNHIKNILVSIKYEKDGQWYDATKANTVLHENIPAFITLTGSEVVTGNDLNLDDNESPLYNFNFYKSIYLSTSNLSYWNLSALPSAENLSSFGINKLSLFIYYLSPEAGLITESNEENYGPYLIPTSIGEIINPVVKLESGDLGTNESLGIGNYNERVFISGDKEFIEFNSILIENIAKIENLSESTYKTIRYFISTNLEYDLSESLNVKKYNGEISGVTDKYIYEINVNSKYLTIFNLTEDEIIFNLFFAIVEDNGKTATVNEDGSYRIISVPKTQNETLKTIPFKITRMLESFNINLSHESNLIYPYGEEEKYYVLQNNENNVIVEIVVPKSDSNLFELISANGAIKFENNEYLSCMIGNQPFNLNEIIQVIFSTDNREEKLKDIFIKDETEQDTIYKIKLSTKNISFEENQNEVESFISLTYTINETNLPESYKQTTKSTEYFYIYSGKVQNAFFQNNEEPYSTDIIINKEINLETNEFIISVENEDVDINNENSVIYLKNGNYYLNVKIDGYGINDTYSLISSNSSVAVLTWDNTESAYIINFVANGEAVISLKANYPHVNFEEKELNIIIKSNYSIKVEYNQNNIEERIISYNPSTGYQILGRSNDTAINLIDLITIKVLIDGSEKNITDLFDFRVTYLNQEDVEKRIDIINDNATGKTIGFKINKNFGMAGALQVYFSNSNIGISDIFNIIIIPNSALTVSISEHDSDLKPNDAPQNSFGVYNESNIKINSLTYKTYDLITNTYSGDASLSLLKYILILEDGTKIYGSGNDIYTKIEFENYATISESNLYFYAGIQGKYILRITDSESEQPDSLDLVNDLTFYVFNNVKLNTNNFDVKLEEINGQVHNVVYLNNFYNPVLNGQTISFIGNKIIFGETKIEIEVLRKYGLSNFKGKFNFELLEESGQIVTVNNAKKETEVLLKATYGNQFGEFWGETFYIKLYIAPNITLKDNNYIIYDGDIYVSLYPSLSATTLKNSFTINDNLPFSINLGAISLNGNILSLPRLYSLNGQINITNEGKNYKIIKTEEGLIKTQIIVYTNENDRQSRIFNALIVPFDWEEFINYTSDVFSKTSDIKDVLFGTFQEEMISGESLVLKDYVLGDKLGSLINSSTTKITYKLFKIEDSGQETEINLKNNFAYLDASQGVLELITHPFAQNNKFRIEFTYIGKASGYEDATFVFNYYVNVLKGQKIDISYPHINETTTYPLTDENLTIEQLLEKHQSDPNKIFETTKKHIVYYDQFVKGLYNIDLNSSLRNFNSNSPYVNVYNLANGEWVSQAQSSAMDYNKITYSLYKLFVGGTEITSNFSSFVSVSTDGKVELKLQENVMGIIIKAQTSNLSENYYLIWTTPRGSETVSISEGEESRTLSMNDEITIINNFSLDKFESTVDEIKFAIINEFGKIQTSDDMIYIDIDTNSIIVKSSPNQQSAILVVYTEELGTLVEVKLIADSPIVVDYDKTKVIYGDSEISITDLISIKNENKIFSDEDLEALTYNLVPNNLEEWVSYNSENKMLTFKPISKVKDLEIKFNIYGEGLNGTSEENPCSITISLKINPRIEKEKDKHSEIIANSEGEISLSGIFKINAFENDANYKFKVNYSWDGGNNETITVSPDNGDLSIVYNNDDDSWSIKNSLTVTTSNVVLTRTATITVSIYKEVDGSVIGERVVGTYTLTIKPKYTLEINYPDYGTGATMESESVYVGQSEFFALTSNDRIVIKQGENKITDLSEIKFTVPEEFESYLSVNETSGKITIKEEGKNIVANKTVRIDIYLKNGNEGSEIYLPFGAYYLVLSPTPVLGVEFPESSQPGKTEHSETIPDTAITAGEKVFQLKDGYIKIQTKQNTLDKGIIYLELLANKKYSYFNYGEQNVKPVRVYIIGGQYVEYAKMFILENENGGGIESLIATVTGVTDFDILGSDDDANICGLSNGVLVFKQSGDWQISITTAEGTKKYYVSVDQNKIATYFSETTAPSEITAFDVLGTVDDANICGLSDGVLVFKQSGNWQISITTAEGTKKYFVSVDQSKTVTYFSETTAPSEITAFDVLGTDDDANICGIENGVIIFYKDGLWPIKVVTNSETNFYYVSVNNKVATYYEPIELKNNALSLASIFGNINNKDMYEYVINPENSVGTDAIHSSNVVQPYSKINFFYTNGNTTYKIPFSQAEDYFKNINTTFTSSSEEPETIEITNKFGTVVGTYKYTIVKDYKFEDGVFDEIVVDGNGEFTSENNLSQYKQDEFNALKNSTIKISKTLNLNAGQTYNLFEDILKDLLGLTRYYGEEIGIENCELSLEYGDYITNSGFKTDKNSLISIPKNENNYMITPHGAQNGGDIVHLKLTLKETTYYLRINILPKVQIESLSSTGESIIMCNSNDELMKVPLSSIIYANSEVDPSKLQISVISNEYSIYVQGEGNNRNQKLYDDQGNTLENYGIVLNKTVLGGPVIKIVVFDEYGYQVADSTGNPIILTIYYKNKDGDSIQVDLNQSSSNVYEGDAFEIWAKCEVNGEIKYFKYDNGTWGDGQTAMPLENDNISFIILENIPLGTDTDKPIQVTIALAESQELKNKLDGTTLLNGSELNFIGNTHFENQEKITGNNFILTIKATVGKIPESISLQVNTTINQRYKLVFKSPYVKYETLYVPHGEAKDSDVSKYFVLYDIKNSKVVEPDSGSMGITVSEGKGFVNVTTPQFDINGFVNDGSGTWEGTYKYTVNGANIEGSLIFNYQLTQKYFGVDTSQANIVGSYGVVVPGSATNSAIEINVWGNGIKLVDYYGNKTSIIDETADEFVDNTSLNPGAGETVVVNVYGDSSTQNKNTLIGTIKVTRAKYYDVNVTEGATIKENNGILPFKDGWGDVIKAVVSGETSEEAISGGLSGFFSYNIIDSAAKVVYDESQGTYVINTNNAGSFTLEISYMNVFLGNVYFGKIGDKWVVSKLNFQPITVDQPTSTTISGGNNTTEGAGNHVAYMIGTGSSTPGNGHNGTGTTINIPATFKGKPVVAIGDNAFSNLTSLTTINIPNSVTIIGSNAFNGCSGLYTVTIDSKNISSLSLSNSYLLSNAEVVYVKTGLSVESFTKQETSDKSDYDMYYKTSLNIDGLVFQPINTLTPANGSSSYNTTEGAGNHVAYMVGTGSSTPGNGYNGTGTTINIPATFKGKPVVAIGSYAFRSLTSLTSLNLTNATNLKLIGDNAFDGCSGFTGNLTIPDSVTTIGNGAFSNCTGFTGSLTIGNLVTSIGEYAFHGCSGFTRNLIIGSSVKTIDSYAFYGCSGFTGNLTIPDLVTTIGSSAFRNCTGFTGNLTIGSSVEVIGDGAFRYCSGFTGSLTIPNSVETIGDNAFDGCSGFTGSLTIPDSVTTIGNGAFSNCTGFTGSLTIGNLVTSIGEYAFHGCSKFTGDLTIPNSVTSIGDSAFDGCSGLYTVTIDSENISSLSSSDSHLLSNADVVYIKTGLSVGAYITGSFTKQATSDKSDYDMYYKTSLSDLVFQPINTLTPANGSSSYNTTEGAGNHVAYMIGTGSSTFGNGYNGIGTTINIPSTFKGKPVVAVGNNAFRSLRDLTTLTLTNATNLKLIGEYAFEGCSGFTGSLTIPNSVTSIGNYAFSYCSGFTGSLTISNSVETIGDNAFYNCSGFTGSLTIPDSVTSVGSSAFYGCNNLHTVTIDSGDISSLSSSDSDLLSNADVVYVKTGLRVGAYITDSFTKQATSDKSGYDMYYKTSLLGLVFQPINTLTPANGSSSYNTTEGAENHVAYMIGTGSSTYGNGYNGTGSEISIPATFKGKPVVAIGNNAFRESSIIEYIGLNKITLIGESAFRECSMLEYVALGDNLKTIGNYAFYDCKKMGNSTIPAEKNLNIPDSVETIGDYAFYNCSGFTGLTIGSEVQTIGDGAFANNLFESIQIDSKDICEMDSAPGNIYDNAEYLFVSNAIDEGSIGEAITASYDYKGTFGSLHYYMRKEITP